MKLAAIGLLCMIGVPALAYAGNSSSGGGDLCEDRIKVVRDDIRDWIVKSGAQGLTLPSTISLDQYSKSMLAQIASTKVKCVGAGDQGYPVMIDGTAKVCRFDISPTGGQITCDYTKFQAMSDSDQYVLVHHEYAGLAGLELPRGDDSTYTISNQLTGFLVNEVVKKLAVNPVLPGASVLDKVLHLTEASESVPALLYIDLAKRVGSESIFSSARNQLMSGSSDTYGHDGYLTLKDALTDLAAWLDIAEFHRDLLPGTVEYQKQFLQEVRQFSVNPEIATGLSDSDLDAFDLKLNRRSAALEDTLLQFRFEDGQVVVRAKIGGSPDVPPVLAKGSNFAEALKAAMANLSE